MILNQVCETQAVTIVSISLLHLPEYQFYTNNVMNKKHRSRNGLLTFLVGECITGAGGDGGPLGIFLLILNKKLYIKWQIYLIFCSILPNCFFQIISKPVCMYVLLIC